MGAVLVLCGFSTILLLAPPQSMMVLLELMPLPMGAKQTLAVVVVFNALLCIGFERYLAGRIARWLRRAKTRSRTKSRAYKVVENVEG